ncbi:SMC-Scp complex subunit ScpB [Agromyces sp. Leaf222]|uniref:SMC-Scp complex subunit ScpB n=1 Tax=Agromyces sp. Leaf222 TaxID=1735688 RepID=UPI0009E68368|nr:SMC-Scp complex subunit ScpB [Agromyces sp. Leaf222]
MTNEIEEADVATTAVDEGGAGPDTAAEHPTRPDDEVDGATEGPELSIVTPLDVPGQPHLDLDRALEAILFIADEPQSVVHLAAAVQRPVAEVRAAIARLRADYDGTGVSGEPRTDVADANDAARGIRRGFELREVGGGWRFYVRTEYDALVSDFVIAQTSTRLSQAALETLSVIAYKQPISRSQIASIRAVNVDSVVRTLLGRGLITEVDTDAETGALLYGTTELLLTNLGVNSIDELPHISPLLDDGQEGFERD